MRADGENLGNGDRAKVCDDRAAYIYLRAREGKKGRGKLFLGPRRRGRQLAAQQHLASVRYSCVLTRTRRDATDAARLPPHMCPIAIYARVSSLRNQADAHAHA